MATSDKRALNRRAVGLRYGGRGERTVRRWKDKGLLPPPDLLIADRDYWFEATLDEHDRANAAARGLERHTAAKRT